MAFLQGYVCVLGSAIDNAFFILFISAGEGRLRRRGQRARILGLETSMGAVADTLLHFQVSACVWSVQKFLSSLTRPQTTVTRTIAVETGAS